MADGKHCPKCSKDIGIWPIVFAGLPSRIRCPHCKTILYYHLSLMPIVFLLVLSVIVVLASFFFTDWVGMSGRAQIFMFAALAAGLWFVIELFLAAYLRTKKILRQRDL